MHIRAASLYWSLEKAASALSVILSWVGVGAVIGGFVFGVLGISVNGLIGSIITATVGAIILLFLVGVIEKS